MRTVGQVLKEEREKKFYTLDEIEKATKIRRELLEALELGQYQKLPPLTFIQGFIKNYGKFLGLNTEKLLAIFRREFSEGKNPPRILESFSNPLDRKKFTLTPAKFVGATVLAMIVIFFVYLWFEYRFLTGAPFLEVTQPVNQTGVETATILVSGRTDPEAKVSINNQEIQAGPDGKFAQEINLTEGSNNIVITATSPGGKVSKVERNVFLRKL
ncbi:helix-turn-helix domain-containing protein, partial [Candidatus Daviesbacteria bacterium]|nr:helix-turn-helix domain-containing protein [Candidatus Daviesbacteria bacterium]